MRAPFVITARGHLIEKPLTEIERLTSYLEAIANSNTIFQVIELYTKMIKS